ncbi:AAA family ATPase [Salinarimonas sp. NSM]|uniref:AAA family ATPase n=1 Tax=Salinarimonas sp. NSM TaxID=3458003 RepID=UPI0040357F21
MTDLSDSLVALKDAAGAPEPAPWDGDDGEAAVFVGADALDQARRENVRIFLTATESDQRALTAIGALAVTTEGGFSAWAGETARDLASSFIDLDVVVVAGEYPKKAPSICAALREAGAAAVRLLELPGTGAALDWTHEARDPGNEIYDLADAVEPWRPETEAKKRSQLGIVFGRDIERAVKPHAYLVDDMITEGEVCLLGGASGTGKTFLILDIAFAIIRGAKFLGRFDTKRGPVVYQAGEGANALRTRRITAYRRELGIPEDHDLPLAVIPRRINLFRDDADTEKVIADLKLAAEVFGEPVKAFIVDTVSKASTGADENSGKDVGAIIARCQRIREETGVTVILVIHTNADGSKVRGHTSWKGDVDSVLICERRLDPKTKKADPQHRDANKREIRDLRVEKLKEGEDGWSVPFVLRGHVLGHRENGKEITSCTVEPPDMGDLPMEPSQAAVGAPRMADKPRNYLKAIKMALDEHGEPPPPGSGIRLPPHMLVVHRKHVIQAYDDMYQGQETDPKNREQNMRKARERLGDKLIANGFMFTKKDWFWLTTRGLAQVTGRPPGVTDPASNVTDRASNVTAPGDHVTPGADPVTDDDLSDLPDLIGGA